MNSDFCILFSRLIKAMDIKQPIRTLDAAMCGRGTSENTLAAVRDLIEASDIQSETSSSDIMDRVTFGSPNEIASDVEAFAKKWNQGNLSKAEEQQEFQLIKSFLRGGTFDSYDYRMEFERSSDKIPTEHSILIVNADSPGIAEIFPVPATGVPFTELDKEAKSCPNPKSEIRVYLNVPFSRVQVKDDLTYHADFRVFQESSRKFNQYASIEPLFPWRFLLTPSITEVITFRNKGGINFQHVYVNKEYWMEER